MGNMQQIKGTNNFSEIEEFASNPGKLTTTLSEVIGKFNLKSHLASFDVLKSKGLAISSLVSILAILPFYGFASVCALVKAKIRPSDLEMGKKDVYYDVKNNEFINWRSLLLLHAKRFQYLMLQNKSTTIDGIKATVFDDTPIKKTGMKTEKVSVNHDHVSGEFILGYKLLVCGFWDGGSFIPLDFSFHRERGTKVDKLIKIFKKAKNVLENTNKLLATHKTLLLKKEQNLLNTSTKYASNPIKTNNVRLLSAEAIYEKTKAENEKLTQDLSLKQKAFDLAKKQLKQFYTHERLFGLTSKERKEQYKKAISPGSYGHIRRREADKSKIDLMIAMLTRSVKNGFIPDYVLIDSWFFCYELLNLLSTLKNGSIKLVSMVKINNQKFFDCQANKEMNIKTLLQKHETDVKACKKLKAQYIRVTCKYKGIRVNLFFVKMGRSQNWHLLLTTDLSLSFIDLMKVYQIRWSIEVFFKECKQYLNLGKCKSTSFDAQIADTTVTMLQHIMLSYYKRINTQQSFDGIFTDISKEMVEMDLVSRMIDIIWELIEIIASIEGIDFIEFQEQLMRDDKVAVLFLKMIPQRALEKSA